MNAVKNPEPAPLPTSETRPKFRYELYSFACFLLNFPSNGHAIPALPICGHYAKDKRTHKIHGQSAVPFVLASTLSGRMEEKVLDIFIEDGGLKRLINIHLKKEWTSGKESRFKGRYKYGHAEGVVEVTARLENENADYLVEQYPHVFRPR
jgi:hypothetical protein